MQDSGGGDLENWMGGRGECLKKLSYRLRDCQFGCFEDGVALNERELWSAT